LIELKAQSKDKANDLIIKKASKQASKQASNSELQSLSHNLLACDEMYMAVRWNGNGFEYELDFSQALRVCEEGSKEDRQFPISANGKKNFIIHPAFNIETSFNLNTNWWEKCK